MTDHLQISIPCYYTKETKKKSTTFLIGMNWYATAHRYIKNKVKQDIHVLIVNELKTMDFTPIKGHYEVAYVYHYKNMCSDLPNVTALSSKYFLDAAQEVGLVEEDNVQYCKKEASYVGEQDRENPRVEVFIRPYSKEDKEHTNA